MALVTTIGGNAAGLVAACEQSKRSLDGLSRYSAITGRNFKKMSGLIDSAVGSLGNLTSALSSGDITGAAQAIQTMTLSTKGFTSILGKANPAVASFVKNMGGLLGKIGLIGGLLGILGKGISDAISKARELREQKFAEEWDKQHVALTKYSGEIADHIVNLETLKAKVHDNTLSLKERKKAIQDIQAIVPEYTASISNEGRVTKENTTALENYINKLFQYYTTLAWKDKWIEMIKKGIDAQLELEKATKKVQDAQAGVDEMNRKHDNLFYVGGGGISGGSWMGGGQSITESSTMSNLRKMESEQKKAQQKLDEVNKEQENLKKHYQESVKANGDFNPDGPKTTKGGKGGGGKTTPIEIKTQALDIKPIESPFSPKMLKSLEMPDEFVHKSITQLEIQLKLWQQKAKDATTDSARDFANKQAEAIQKSIKAINDRTNGKIDVDVPKLFEDTNEEITPHQKKLLALADTYSMVGDGLADLGSAMNAFASEEMKAVGTMLGATSQLFAVIGQVIAAGGAQGLAKDLAKGWPANIAAIATTIGLISTVIATIGSLSSMKFAQGGIVGGGSYTGDKVMAAVNSGEMVLNRTQQAHLFRMVNNQTKPNTWEQQEVVFKIRGKQLIGVLSNQDKINNKI